MITQEPKPRLKPQACPLCGQEQEIIFNGHYNSEKSGQVVFDSQKGYSFCNCRNIFFTDWSNVEQEVYDQAYGKKYDNDHVRNLYLRYASEYFPIIKHLTDGKKFLEIGAVAPFLLDEAKAQGYQTAAFDIIPHKFEEHLNISGNFEKSDWIAAETVDNSFAYTAFFEGFDVIWASHIFEHFQNPIAAAKKAYDQLAPGGVLFVAMPDPWFIDFKAPHLWGHFHLKEHHIFWDMDSFCAMMEEQGFQIVLKKRNVTYDFICIGDMHLIFQKVKS